MALTGPRNTTELKPVTRQFTAAGIIYSGGLVAIKTTDGTAVAASDSADLKVVGRADNNAVSNGTINTECGCFLFENDDTNGFTDGDIGATAYVKDDETVCTVAGSSNSIVAGTVFKIEDDSVWIIIK